MFDDYLNLMSQDLSDIQCLVFSGKSGSGKSTYIHHLLNYHPSYKNIGHLFITSRPIWKNQLEEKYKLIVLDELLEFKDYIFVIRQLRKGIRVIVANHLSPKLIYALKVHAITRQYELDNNAKKIENYLVRKQCDFQMETINRLYRKYKFSYTDVDIILEACPSKSFDKAFTRFQRFYQISY